MTKYDEFLEHLKEARETEEKAKASMKQAMDTLKASDAYTLLQNILDVSHGAVETLEKEIKDLALTEYNATQNKHVHEKIEVKIFKVFKVLDPKRLRNWVIANLQDALEPNMDKVRKYALEIGDVDGAEKIEEPRVQIASKL